MDSLKRGSPKSFTGQDASELLTARCGQNSWAHCLLEGRAEHDARSRAAGETSQQGRERRRDERLALRHFPRCQCSALRVIYGLEQKTCTPIRRSCTGVPIQLTLDL